MKLVKILLALILIGLFAMPLYAQISGTGSIVVLIASTPTPSSTPTPTPSGSCPSGFTCFSPKSFTGPGNVATNYGAGGVTLPTLRANYHTFICGAGEQGGSSGPLQAAINSASAAGTDLVISASSTSPCQVEQTVSLPSNFNLMCQSSVTPQIYSPNTTAQNPEQINISSVTNVTVSNCNFKGANTYPPIYADYPNGSFAFTIEIQGTSNNITIEDNSFAGNVSQAAVEALNSTVPTPLTNIFINWNNFTNCGLYGPVWDNVNNSTQNNNYLQDCQIGGENDLGTYTLNNDTVNNNYYTRFSQTYNLSGNAYLDYGANSTNPFSAPFFCGLNDHGSGTTASSLPSNNLGCSAVGNVVNGNGFFIAFENVTGQGGTSVNQNPTGTYSSTNYCYNGCVCGFAGNGTQYDNSGCTATAP